MNTEVGASAFFALARLKPKNCAGAQRKNEREKSESAKRAKKKTRICSFSYLRSITLELLSSHVLVVLHCSPVLVVPVFLFWLSWLFCLGCPVPLSWQSYADCPVLSVLFCLDCAGFPVLAVPFWLSRANCSVLAILFWLSSPFCPSLAISS